MTLQVLEIGMFLCRMDQNDKTRLRILDNFSLSMSMDTSQTDLSIINIDVQPLVLRLSLRDVLLAVQIVKKVSELSAGEKKETIPASEKKARQIRSSDGNGSNANNGMLKQRTSSGHGTSAMTGRRQSQQSPQGQPRRRSSIAHQVNPNQHEELSLTLNGIRVVLLGDVHELPILDLSVKKFQANARDWSTELSAGTNISMFVNVYNFSKSAWEPFIEPWELGFRMSRKQDPANMSIELRSDKMMELSITSATIALASHSAQFLNQKADVLSKPRGLDTPYRIRNHTGFDINIWTDMTEEQDKVSAKLADGEEVPWRFEEWEKMRENLSTDVKSAIVAVSLEGTNFQHVEKISVNREGEFLYNLKPRVENVLHRLLVEVRLGLDHIKYITFRSPLLVENNTQIPIEMGVYDHKEGHLLKVDKVPPGQSRPAPIGAAYLKQLLVRPGEGFGYGWSTDSLWWRDLLRRPKRTISCEGESDDSLPPFYFQMNAVYDKTNPLCR